MKTLSEKREELCKTFAKHNVKNSHIKDLFLKKRKIHDMKTRKGEKYKVTMANTERLKHSTVPYLQRLLNQNDL